MSSSKDALIAQIQKNLAELASLEIKKSKQMQAVQHLEGLNEVSEVLLLQELEETNKQIREIKDKLKNYENALLLLDALKGTEGAEEMGPDVLVYNPNKNTMLKPLFALDFFDKEQQKNIVSQMSEILSGLFSIVELESMKLARLDQIVSHALKALTLNTETIDALSNEQNKKALLNMMLYAYYMLTSVNQKTANNYAQVFKDNLTILRKSMSETNVRHLMGVLSKTQNCLRIVPLVYCALNL